MGNVSEETFPYCFINVLFFIHTNVLFELKLQLLQLNQRISLWSPVRLFLQEPLKHDTLETGSAGFIHLRNNRLKHRLCWVQTDLCKVCVLQPRRGGNSWNRSRVSPTTQTQSERLFPAQLEIHIKPVFFDALDLVPVLSPE